MGMSIPWAIMAAGGVSLLLSRQERAARNLAMVLFIIVLAASPIRWLFREIDLARLNVSNTIRHPVYLSPDMKRIMDALNQEPGRKVVLAAPGLPAQLTDEQGQPIPDTFVTPILPDLNPIASGLTGAYTYAGHWSETPNYNRRVGELQRLFFRDEPRERKVEFLQKVGATHLIVPVPAAFSTVPVLDLAPLGNTVVDGNQFRLVKL
jgi:arabinosyltransferase C